ncbi:sugar ABC transporter ATP-binding protein [Nonomuraea sp. NPDC049141]|uniref:sugar ABC transporter ATP-binding protein n=1 Tax=Nonomuraea sp. NPDC049141 TaxID=3155500 RepID=UPI0033FE52A8
MTEIAQRQHDQPPGPPLIDARQVVKYFGPTCALAGLDLRLEIGEIHALVGRNGAGKSTFIKILAGLHDHDHGTIEIRGQPLDRSRNQLAFIHQDLGLVGAMSVADNFGLVAGFDTGRSGLVADRCLRRETAASLAALGVELDPRMLVSELSPSDRTLVAIARALHRDARAVVLDEPTASLPAADVARLLNALRHLRDRGVGVLYVSHRLAEVRALADRITVLRGGVAELTVRPDEVSESELATSIMGATVARAVRTRRARQGEIALRVRGFVADGVGPLDIDVKAGEVVGCAGLRGAGQSMLGRALYGLLDWSGVAEVGGAPYRATATADALRAGVAYVGGDRGASVAAQLTVAENLLINPRHAPSGGWRVSPRRERAVATELIERYGIRTPGPGSPLAALSGGNAQKVVLARALETAPRVLLLEEPTSGVDVGARADFYRLIDDACQRGLAVVLASSDEEEVCEMSDRVLVFERGVVRRQLTTDAATVKGVAAAAMGAVEP